MRLKNFITLLLGFIKVKNPFSGLIFLSPESKAQIDMLSTQRQNFIYALLEGLTPEQIAKKLSNGKALSQVMAHITMAKNAVSNLSLKNDYRESNGKDFVRLNNIDQIRLSKEKKGIKDGLILSLTSFQFLMEKRIYEDFKAFKIVACEMDLGVVFKMIETLIVEKLPFVQNIIVSKIGEVINTAPANTFAHVNLDFCQTLKTFGNDIETAIKRNIVKEGGTIMITVSSRAKDVNTAQQLRSLVEGVGGQNYKIVFEYAYRDTSPMYSMIVRRIK